MPASCPLAPVCTPGHTHAILKIITKSKARKPQNQSKWCLETLWPPEEWRMSGRLYTFNGLSACWEQRALRCPRAGLPAGLAQGSRQASRSFWREARSRLKVKGCATCLRQLRHMRRAHMQKLKRLSCTVPHRRCRPVSQALRNIYLLWARVS